MLKRKTERSGHRAAIYDLEPAADGFYSAAADGYIVHWHRQDVDFGRVVASVENGKFLSLISPAPGLLVAGSLDGGVHWLYPEDHGRNLHLAHHRRGTFFLFTVGEEFFSGGGDGVLTRWSVPAARSLESLPLSANSLRCVAYDPIHDRLAIGASDGFIYLVNRGTFRLLDKIEAHQPSVFAVAFARGGNMLVSGGRDAELRSWEIGGGKLFAAQAIPAHLSTINALSVHPSNEYFATASRDKTVKLWRTADLELLKVIEVVRDRGHVNSVNTLTWLDEKTLITAGDDRRILEWEMDSFYHGL